MNENQASNEEFSYDVVAYPGLIVPQTHPDRLAVIAELYGMNPTPAEKCKVLELGCGTGTNLNWLAYNLPESEFVGVDLAQNHINEANKNAAELELRNVSFFQMDVMEINEKTFGKFDYIIAHGLFSWVPDFVREKVLSLYDELLNPNGVGFISYNVYPGCHRRRIIEDMMSFHTQRFENPVEKVQQGVAFINFLTEHTVNSPAYHEILKYELQRLVKRSIENIYHDDLAELNQPFYFTEFIAEAEKHNLKFLSEIDYLAPQKNNMSEEVIKTFENISQNIIEYEQYSDFLDCRRFRQTLLCKKDVTLEREISPAKIKKFYISSLLKPTSPTIDLNPDSFKEFISKKSDKVKIGHVLTKVVLANLVNIGSHPVKFDELIESAIELLQSQGVIYEDTEKEIGITASLLLRLYSPSSIGFHTIKAKILDYVSEKPGISKFTCWQLNQGNSVVNFYGVGKTVQDTFTYWLLNLLDGTRTREDLIAELTKLISSNEEIDNKETFLAHLPENLDKELFILAKMGFLVG